MGYWPKVYVFVLPHYLQRTNTDTEAPHPGAEPSCCEVLTIVPPCRGLYYWGFFSSFARSKKGDNLLLPPLRLAPPVSPVALGFGCFDVLPHSPAWASLACFPVFGFFQHTLQSALPVYHSVPLQGSVANNTSFVDDKYMFLFVFE